MCEFFELDAFSSDIFLSLFDLSTRSRMVLKEQEIHDRLLYGLIIIIIIITKP